MRVTLMAYPQPFGPDLRPDTHDLDPAPHHGQTYTAAQADLIFRSGDDLLLNPPNGDFPPTQFYSSARPPPAIARRLFLAGDRRPGNARTTHTHRRASRRLFTPVGDTNLVRVSIVVFYKRNPLITIDTTYTTPPSERMVVVSGTPIARRHPDVAQPASPAAISASSARHSNYLNLKAGQWIMLSQLPTSGSSLRPTAGSRFQAR